MEKKTWLKQEIDRRGWKGREFARQIGRSPTHAHRLITGAERPSPKLCREIARVFGVTEQEVMRRVGHLSDLPDDYDKAQEQELIEIFQGLSYSDRKMLIEFAQFLFSRDVDDDEENGEDEGD
jgi:plasmid maintenance system antidote protein VapI